MTHPLRAALVGCGSVAQRGVLPHLSCADAKARVQLVAVVDAVAERARLSAEKFSVPCWFTDIGDMLATVEVDMVLVITPIQYHFAHAMAAIAAGKHVYVQKSMTATLDEANRLLAARDAAGVKLVAAPGFELFPTTAQMRDVVRSGLIGKIGFGYTYAWGFGHEFERVRSGNDPLTNINPMWYYRKGAGPLPDVTIYSLQLATSILGPVVKVTALGNKLTPVRTWRDQTIEIEVEDNVVLLMEFASGAIVTGVGADTGHSKRNPWGGLGLYGTHGSLEITEVDGATGYPLKFNVFGGGGWGTHGKEVGDRIYEEALTAQKYLQGEHLEIEEGHLYVDIMELADAIVEDRPPRAGGEQARHVVEIIECAHKAIATGQTQHLTTRF
ncbi:MAG: Gfo/Idh/MocA family oxidoreductase [Anaerolineae bacterium]|nr:Gfo/Idh/MocA family oxidoreductase [Candidatus Roseilinea sp.]MDW8451501.1 Gfo/Idh/MocA family oxidoreductase [Anaerolineae bacterium]